MESSQTDSKEAAAVALAEAFTAFMEAMQECVTQGVDIMAELEKQGIELPPAFALMFAGAAGADTGGYDYPADPS